MNLAQIGLCVAGGWAIAQISQYMAWPFWVAIILAGSWGVLVGYHS